jgi:ABC-2 type transport system ATP-binding protein
MLGQSYGGGIQFAAASVDPRLDTIIPMITWNDLSYSLSPNNAGQSSGVSTSTPGALSSVVDGLLTGLGFGSGVSGAANDPSRLIGCPNYPAWICSTIASAAANGYFPPSAVANYRHASVASYMRRIRIPVLLMQGEQDYLFNLNEATATYQALRDQGTPVKMIWQQWGHGSNPAPGEWDSANVDPKTQYEAGRVEAWLDHYLKGAKISTGPGFAYFRSWVSYSGNAKPAYATAPEFPVGSAHRMYLSGDGSLVRSAKAVASGTQSFTTTSGGAPTSADVNVNASADVNLDAPGTAAGWLTPPLAAPLRIAGSPTLRLTVTAPTAAITQKMGPSGQLVLFVKILDVPPTGGVETINGMVAPIRIADVTKPVTVTMPAFVHQFATGHRLKLVVAGGSAWFHSGLVAAPVQIAGGTTQVLTLPVV